MWGLQSQASFLSSHQFPPFLRSPPASTRLLSTHMPNIILNTKHVVTHLHLHNNLLRYYCYSQFKNRENKPRIHHFNYTLANFLNAFSIFLPFHLPSKTQLQVNPTVYFLLFCASELLVEEKKNLAISVQLKLSH